MNSLPLCWIFALIISSIELWHSAQLISLLHNRHLRNTQQALPNRTHKDSLPLTACLSLIIVLVESYLHNLSTLAAHNRLIYTWYILGVSQQWRYIRSLPSHFLPDAIVCRDFVSHCDTIFPSSCGFFAYSCNEAIFRRFLNIAKIDYWRCHVFRSALDNSDTSRRY